jgi:Mor family transcriptional regulator
MQWPTELEAILPPLLQNVMSIIGLSATMALVERFGGLRIYVPQKPTPEHPYALIVGYDNLVALAGVYGGEAHFQLPKAHRALVALRDAKIRSEYGPKSLRKLAVEYGLTERHVSRIVSDSAVNIHQGSFPF